MPYHEIGVHASRDEVLLHGLSKEVDAPPNYRPMTALPLQPFYLRIRHLWDGAGEVRERLLFDPVWRGAPATAPSSAASSAATAPWSSPLDF